VRELFIYYRVRAGDAAAALAAVQRLHAELRERFPGLRARLLQRPETDQGLLTWMETYATDPGTGGIDAAMQTHIETRASALLPLIQGARHTEAFTACAS
jgi:hypothetical protein